MIYNYIFNRVEYINGYQMETRRLPNWIHITITKRSKTKFLTVHSKIHINKNVKVGPDYCDGYSDIEIIKDLSGEIARRFL